MAASDPGDVFLTVRCDKQTMDGLRQLAAEGDRTVAAEIRRALRNHVERWPGRKRKAD